MSSAWVLGCCYRQPQKNSPHAIIVHSRAEHVLASTLLAAAYETFCNTSMDKQVSNTTTILMSSADFHKLL
jgi:hypothetical protein